MSAASPFGESGRTGSPAAASVWRRRGPVLALVWILSAWYAGTFVDGGWIPHDEGTLAQSAERVLQGELPHRDYDEGYTGGLTRLHAVAFRLFGTRLLTLRFVLFASFLAFVPVIFAIAMRFAAPWVAGMVTALAVAWSVPNYFASLPSWYTLFLAALGVLALLRHVETGRSSGLVVAGLCAGLSLLVKVVGIYDIAAVLIFLAYRETALASAHSDWRPAVAPGFLWLKGAGAIGLVAALVVTLEGWRSPMNLVYFVLPGAVVAGLVVWSEGRHGRGSFGVRCHALFRLWAPFALGVAAPVVVFVVPYVAVGAVPDLLNGVFRQPMRQIAMARVALPPVTSLLAAVPYALLLMVPAALRGRSERRWAAALAAGLFAALLLSSSPETYRLIWSSARSLNVVAVIAGGVLLVRSESLEDRTRQGIFLLMAVTALMSLVQFPFSAPIYFCYVAPLAGVTLAAIALADGRAPRLLHLCVLVFYVLFGVVRMNPSYVFALGRYAKPYVAQTPLGLPRGGLRVPAADARVYRAVVAAVEQKAGGGGMWAGPDCPEVYFLSGRRNPTREFFDFLGGPPEPPAAFVERLERGGVRAVVINRSPDFSPPLSPELSALLIA
ncbi:MAG TPA: hypothetical protein VN032_02255, partial [Thermoanaerobaculia bacterium]|nr:hypothetical protein [Thermoanaerobaculia bacterium]